MVHKNRRFQVGIVSTVEELANKIYSEHTWCGCNGFRVADTDYFFLNDSFGGGIQEYAVVKQQPDGTMFQLESITFGWVDTAELAATYINKCLSGESDDVMGRMAVSLIIEDPKEHGRCPCCM